MDEITFEENEELRSLGLVIHPHWDGRLEGWSYSLHRMGEWDKALCWKKSPRAVYRFAKRVVQANKRLQSDASPREAQKVSIQGSRR